MLDAPIYVATLFLMKITFDQAKRDVTFSERGLAFEDAADVFGGDTFIKKDTRRDYGEPRFQTVGFLDARMVRWCGPRAAKIAT